MELHWCQNTAMDSPFASALQKAITRVFDRLGVISTPMPYGLKFSHLKGVQSEFLPRKYFEYGAFVNMANPERLEGFSLESPGFLAALWPNGVGTLPSSLEGLQLQSSWELKMVSVSAGHEDRRLKRVEEVPEMNAYQSISPPDGLPKGPWDVYTEWYLFSEDPERWRESLLARFRITDLDDKTYFCSRWATTESGRQEKPQPVWERLVGQKGGGSLLILSPAEKLHSSLETRAKTILQIWSH
jgi:hypothetical protein